MSQQPTAAPDFGAIKTRQQATWASGDYAVVGTTLQIVGETLCEAMNLQNATVLDVAAGNGNATLAAARRWCDVTSTDYVPSLLAGGRRRAEGDGFTNIKFQEADAENLPFADASFDAVLSTFGVMFTPNQERSAAEMLRVTKPGGKIGMANWTPAGFVGQIFKTIGKHLPPPAGVKPPALWGTEARLEELFGEGATVKAEVRNFVFRYKSPEHFLEVFREFYGPMHKAFLALEPAAQTALHDDLMALMARMNIATNGTLTLPSEYLEVVVTKH